MWGNHPGKPVAKYPGIIEKLVARRASSMLSRWLSEAIPPERDAKTDVSAGIIKSAHDDSLSGNNERGGKQPVGFASLNTTAKFG